jgi:RNA polymerase sigma-70 factor (sigma-E family)
VDTAEDFRGFVIARQRSLLRTAWLLTGDWALAEDLVQTALLRAWPHWGRVRGGGREDAYVRRVMVNKSLDWRRRWWRKEIPTEVVPERPVADEPFELRHVVVTAVLSLPPGQRAVVVLRYFDDLSEADVADAMGCSVGTVKSQASKALASLRRHPDLAELQREGSAP